MLGINVVLENTPTRSPGSTMSVTHLPAGFTRSGLPFNTERKDVLLVVWVHWSWFVPVSWSIVEYGFEY